jgi:hypothetical protein
MTWFLVAILVLCAIGLAGSLAMLARVIYVFSYRVRLLVLIDSAAQADIWSGRIGSVDDLMWRLDYFNRIDYDTMVHRFWQPLDSFYPDKAFITPGATRPTF